MRRWPLALAAVLLAGAARAQVYQPGLNGFYVSFDPENPTNLQPGCRRVDAYPWFYMTAREFTVQDISLKRESEFPWPQQVFETVDYTRMMALWSGYLFVPRAGLYEFQLLADDMAVLSLDQQPVVEHVTGFLSRTRRGWAINEPTTARVRLTAGFHQFELFFGSLGPTGGIFLRWREPGADRFTIIPAESLLHDPNEDKRIERPGQFGRQVLGSGTGFVVHPDGWLLTCHHVVTGAGRPLVRVGDKELPAEVVAADARRDLALLKIAAEGLVALPLADPEQVRRQDEVLCFGYPLADVLGLELSTEDGRITAIRTQNGARAFQTNAPVKPGNSGGPMVNLKGQVIGVVNARLEIEGQTQDVAFAVPIDYARALLARIPNWAPAAGGDETLTPAEVDQRVSPAVLPILIRPAGGDG